MRMLAGAFLTATAAAIALAAGCASPSGDVDPAVASAINSLQRNPDIPDSWVQFTRAAIREGLVDEPGDVQRIGESFSHACLDYAITDDLGRERTSDDDIRRALADQDDVHVTAEQFDRLKPALEKMCADMKADRTRPAAALSPRPAVVSPVSTAELGASWRPGCPVSPAQLRRIELDYVGFDGAIHRGRLVVHQDLVADVIAIFGDLERQRYPIAVVQTVDRYPSAGDELSMEDNNTSAFNCRPLPGTTTWSQHAYGRAIDLNPLLNPYINRRGDLQPHTAARYLDRGHTEPGMLRADDAAVRAFTDRGWTWGGDWRNPIDYQHFERR